MWIVSVVACSLFSTPPEPEPKEPPPPIKERVEKLVVTTKGKKRSAWLHVPEADPDVEDPPKLPLVIALHGQGVDGKRMGRLFEDHMDQGVALLFPNGRTAKTDGKPKDDDDDEADAESDDKDKGGDKDKGKGGKAKKKVPPWRGIGNNGGTEDVQFLKDLVDEVADEHPIDDKRVFVVGERSGGALAFHLACLEADEIAGVAVIGQSMPRELSEQCKPSEPVPLLLIAGTEDDKVLWTGRDQMLGIVESAEQLFEANGCDEDSHSETLLDDVDVDDGARIKQHDWTCEDAPVRVLEMSGVGGGWPGDEPKDDKERVAMDIDGAQVVLAWFIPED